MPFISHSVKPTEITMGIKGPVIIVVLLACSSLMSADTTVSTTAPVPSSGDNSAPNVTSTTVNPTSTDSSSSTEATTSTSGQPITENPDSSSTSKITTTPVSSTSRWITFLKDFEPWYVPDPDAEMPEDWDAERDGHWEPPMMENPFYKGRSKRSTRAWAHFMFNMFKGSRYSWMWQIVFVIGTAMNFYVVGKVFVIVVRDPSPFIVIIGLMNAYTAYNLLENF